MNRRFFTIAVAVIVCGTCFAQTQEILTLHQAIERGLAHSADLRISAGELKEAQARVAQASDRFIPDVGVSGSYLQINKPSIKFTGDNSGNSGSGSDSPLSSFSDLHSVALAQVNASLPLFNGLKLRNEKIMATYLEQAAQYDTATTRDDVIMTTLQAFYNYYELSQTRTVVEENIKRAQQKVKELKNLEDQGLLARNDRLKAELQADNIELGLADINNNLQMAEYNLILLLGYPEGTTIALDTSGIFQLSRPEAWDDYVQQAMNQRSDIQAASFRMKASETNYKIAKAERLPRLSLNAGYVNAWIPNVLTVNNAINAGLSLHYSITGAFHASHLIHEMAAGQEEEGARQQLLSNNVRREVRQNYLTYQLALDKLEINNRAIEQAQENFQITDNKYRQGIALLSDYLDANASLLEAKINYSVNRVNAMLAYYALCKSTGNLNP